LTFFASPQQSIFFMSSFAFYNSSTATSISAPTFLLAHRLAFFEYLTDLLPPASHFIFAQAYETSPQEMTTTTLA
jgi:hypothetical protein